MIENKKVFIIGLARSGYECAKLLIKYNNDITVVDENNEDTHIEELRSMGVNVIIAPRDQQASYLDDSFAVVVRNPGVPLNSSCVLKALELNLPITGEVDIAYNLFPKDIKIVAITGSNGKTTTTTMIYEVLKKSNLPVHLGGNIGYPLTSLVEHVKQGDILVLEISDHQLVNMNDFKSNISILTNIVESHIDFHGTYGSYQEAKKKIFTHHTNADIAIINAGNEVSLELTKDIPSSKVLFSSNPDIKSNLYIKDDSIYYNDELMLNTKDIKLVGNHNYENVMCTLAVCKYFNVDINVAKGFFSEFGGVEHRLELVANINGVEYYNDAKSTNTAATLIALNAFNKPIHLIMGGLDRGHSFDEIKEFKNKIKSIYAYGETKSRINDFASANNIDCLVSDTLKLSINKASSKANNDEVVLLSPACASWDQYKKFEDRGDEFKQEVLEMSK